MLDITQFVHDFATQWEDWYTHLQPDWHLEVSAKDANDFGISLGQDPPEDAIISDWQDIKKGSQNGFFLLLLPLGWWGVGASDLGEDMLSRWASAFDNLRWVLEFLISDENGESDKESDKEGNKEGHEEHPGDNGTDGTVTQSVPAKCATSSNAQHPVSKRSVVMHHPIKIYGSIIL